MLLCPGCDMLHAWLPVHTGVACFGAVTVGHKGRGLVSQLCIGQLWCQVHLVPAEPPEGQPLCSQCSGVPGVI